jgi:hypothetical protein
MPTKHHILISVVSKLLDKEHFGMSILVHLLIYFLHSKIFKVKKHPEEFLQLKSLTVMRAAKEYCNRAHKSSNADVNATIVRLQIDLAKVNKELRDQKALNASERPVDKNRLVNYGCHSKVWLP